MGFIVAPLVIGGVSALLALLISVIDSIVNNYGEVTININEGTKELIVKGGSSLLHTLSSEKIFIPSACGGRGSCGACKCQINTDVGPVLPTETPYLTKEEIDEKTRLSCQVKVKTDINITIPDELFNVQQYIGTVERITDLTHDIKEVLIDLNGGKINYKSGQYSQLVVPKYGKIKEKTQRAYSMSSKPSEKGKVEMMIRLVPGGIATTYVHEQLKEGQKIEVIGPFGDFMKSEVDSTMICVAGGSGMAPFKSILYDMYEKGFTNQEVWYFFGARGKKDIFYLDEMKALEEKWPNFHFVAALSEPDSEDNWTGDVGLITDVLDNYLKTKVSKDKVLEGYLCGSPGMINACNNVMTANNMTLDDIYYDKFA